MEDGVFEDSFQQLVIEIASGEITESW